MKKEYPEHGIAESPTAPPKTSVKTRAGTVAVGNQAKQRKYIPPGHPLRIPYGDKESDEEYLVFIINQRDTLVVRVMWINPMLPTQQKERIRNGQMCDPAYRSYLRELAMSEWSWKLCFQCLEWLNDCTATHE